MKQKFYRLEGRFVTVLIVREGFPNPSFLGKPKMALHGCIKNGETLDQFIKREDELHKEPIPVVKVEPVKNNTTKCRNQDKFKECRMPDEVPECYNVCKRYC